MGAVYFRHKGNFSKTIDYFKKLLGRDYLSILDKYGQMGVDALRQATPIDSGLSAESWNYEIDIEPNTHEVRLIWTNSNLAKEKLNIVILVDRGHVSRSGTWVPGQHFIDPAIGPIISKIAEEVTL